MNKTLVEPIDIFYVLREVGTKKYMPQLDGRGYTHTQFHEGCIPRLFTTARAAVTARTWWLRGPVEVSAYVDYDGNRDETWVSPKQNQARVGIDIEVVEVTLGLR